MKHVKNWMLSKLRWIVGFLTVLSLIAEVGSIFYAAFQNYFLGVLLSTLLGVLTAALAYGYVRLDMASRPKSIAKVSG